jgi:hypothetical protein
MHPDLDPRPRSAALGRLLRELPQSPPPYGYLEFAQRAHERTRAARSVASGQRFAAALVIGVGLIAVVARLNAPPTPVAVQQEAPAPLRAFGPEDENLPPRAGAAERWLASLPGDPVVVKASTRTGVLRLEDRIAELDDLLGTARGESLSAARISALQQERARLLGTLVQVRYAQTLANASP